MPSRYFPNKFPDFDASVPVQVNVNRVCGLVDEYVGVILANTNNPNHDLRGDLYVGNAGIAYMFYRIHKSPVLRDKFPGALAHAQKYIERARGNARHFAKRSDERCAFLCGNAGIYAVSAVISQELGDQGQCQKDLECFSAGFGACKPINFNKYGSDEVLVGRAGFLSGVYWLQRTLPQSPFTADQILEICESMVQSGVQYSHRKRSLLPLMYEYHDSEYLGAAHGVCAIYHMLLNSPWFADGSPKHLDLIKGSIDGFLALQDAEGNFPITMDSTREKRLVHWCHGAPGAVYLLAKAYLVFRDEKYLNSLKLAADLVWKKGLLLKGPGICHGVAGNAYVFLLLHQITKNPLYLYRASKFMDFLCDPEFRIKARIPDRPFSLYEGVAGTVCFLADLLEPEKAAFPFMEVY
ncbi:lanC-like protein 3 homolog [Phlebotomus argentipes]|uniref:lanC-like protein 3 homolog n=1 Tax=Phlebotomus argentipes TaxID=94469 RepID=UPI002893302E|nr:lanC-like protein 3 homolog [Phlebotomus argentipes]